MDPEKVKARKRTFDAVEDKDEGDSDVEDVVPEKRPRKKRRKEVINKYISYCKKHCIPYPEVGTREQEHLDLCHICQELWPLYLFRHSHTMKQPMPEIIKNWCMQTEKERAILLKHLRKEQTAWMKDMLRSRVPSGYQLFIREKRNGTDDLKALKFGDCTSLIAKLWATFTPEQKQVYNDRSMELRIQKKKEVAELPAYRKKVLDRERRKKKAELKTNRPSRPSNPFMLYLNERWKVEKEKNKELKYRDVMNVASKDWETMTELQKFDYRAKFLKSKEAYLAEKQKAEEKKAKIKMSRKIKLDEQAIE